MTSITATTLLFSLQSSGHRAIREGENRFRKLLVSGSAGLGGFEFSFAGTSFRLRFRGIWGLEGLRSSGSAFGPWRLEPWLGSEAYIRSGGSTGSKYIKKSEVACSTSST